MVISQTPYRISFFGGGTDYPVYFKEYGGSVLSTTINHYCYITLRKLPPFFNHKSRISYSKIELFNDLNDVTHPSVRECLRLTNSERVSITHDGDLPARAGLGTSSTFTVGMLNALHALKGEYVDPLTLAKEAIYVEQNMIQENVGVQDQMAAAIGGLNRFYFSSEGYDYRPVVLSEDCRRKFNQRMMLFFTGIFRYATEVAGEQIKNTKSKLAELKEMSAMVDIGEHYLYEENFKDFGKLLHESWLLKRGLSNKISTSEIDMLYERGRKAGATGGKLLGAGDGGFLLFFVEPEYQEAVRNELSELLYVPFEMGRMGSRIIYSSPEI